MSDLLTIDQSQNAISVMQCISVNNYHLLQYGELLHAHSRLLLTSDLYLSKATRAGKKVPANVVRKLLALESMMKERGVDYIPTACPYQLGIHAPSK